MSVHIERERPDTPDAVSLITELDDLLIPLYPIESHHGFSVDRLLAENVAFFVLRADGVAAGCGGVLLVGREYAEVKRMFVRPQHRGRGFARLILDHLIAYAAAAGHTVLRLETGVEQREAIALYERFGFYRIPPFGPYFDDPVSLCYERRLEDVRA
jgi:GNAT superfamily N-acetyltransferase